jgi:hypothetical protein
MLCHSLHVLVKLIPGYFLGNGWYFFSFLKLLEQIVQEMVRGIALELTEIKKLIYVVD